MKFKLFLIVVAIFFVSCKDKVNTLESQANNLSIYQDYVAEVTHGIIPSKSKVLVVLKTPLESLNKGDVLDDNLFKVSPKVDGKVVALDDRTIAFIPEKGFKQDVKYDFSLQLKDLIKDIPDELELLSFFVKIIKQEFNIYTNPIQSSSKEKQYIEGQLRSADILSLETAKELVKATQKGKKITIIFDDAVKEGTLLQFKIDNIQRFDEDTELEVSWNGDKFGIESKGQNEIVIPGKNSFSVLNVVVKNTEKPIVKINFSDPVKRGQNFKGLVVIEGQDDLKFAVVGNSLNVYPSTEIKGAVLLEVFDGIESNAGRKLKNKFSDRVAFEEIKPEVKMLSNGTILPSSTDLKINFEAVNLKYVDVSVIRIYENNVLQFLQTNNLNNNNNLRQVARPIAAKKIELENKISKNNGKWNAHALDLKTLITPEKGAIYRVELSFKPSYSSYECEYSDFETEEETEEENYDEAAAEESSWDNVEDYYDEDYSWSERDNPCHTSYYRNKKVGINILATDIGVTVKKGLNKSYFIAVSNLIDTAPIADAKVTFYNYQQQSLGSVVTDTKGISFFDASNNQAYFVVVESNGQKTYVKLNEGNVLSVSKFNVSGMQLQKGIKGFIFAERGVWRPGDKIFLSFMLNDNANKLPANHPVKLELMNPYNKVVHKEVRTQGLNNFYHFNLKTDKESPTGNWLAKVSVGGASFTKTIKIETIKPNRLKIKTEFGGEILTASKPIKGGMQVKWLHGAIARDLKADITAKFNPKNTTFKTFPGYIFNDPTRSFTTEAQVVYDGKIDGEGKANFSINPELNGNAPGMLTAAFVTKVYENGGDFSTDVFTKPYSPYTTYVGLNTPKGDKTRGMLLTDIKHKFEVVTVDEKGKPKASTNLKISIHKISWKWWWDTSADNLSSYSSSEYRETVFETRINTGANGKGNFHFELKYPEWGRYLVRVEDENGGHSTGKIMYIDWPGWAGKSRKSDPSAAVMLLFSTDKEKYNVGDKAVVTFPSSEGGRALVTVENGSKVLESLWVETTKGETKFELPITEHYTPNIFINIALLQPHASTLNDSPIRLYGIVGVDVENPSTKLEPKIEMPDVLRPEESVTVKISEKNDKAMTYSIAIVDEGLLDLTRFKTPDAWKNFYVREALGVKTWDIYDDVIGAYGGRINQVFAIGGDDELAGGKNKKANRFKPMVVHLGPFTLNKGEAKSHKIKIPKYIGSVRTMVIAGNSEQEAYGKAEKTTPVRKPLMILASLPRKISPREKVTLPVTVFAMEKNVKNVIIKIKKDNAFTIIGEQTKTITFNKPDEKMVYFDLNVSDFKGIGKVIIEASGGGAKASFEIPIDVVNPNAATSEIQDFVINSKASKTVNLETFGINGSNTAEIEFSTLPPMSFDGRMKYLIRYPHGCVEQTTSGAFPQLYLNDIFDLTAAKKGEIQKNIEGAIRRLGGFQRSNGGFSYWPGLSSTNDWGTTYAGHFLLEAEKKGYVMPIGFKSSWVKYQKNTAKRWRLGSSSSDLAQAYRLFTLALSGNADIASMNRLREIGDLTNKAKFRLAAAYGLIGQASVAQEILNTSSIDSSTQYSNSYTYGSPERNRAMVLETYILLKNKAKAKEVAKTVARSLKEQKWMSTQTTAYCLLAMGKFANMVGGKGVKASFKVNGKLEQVSTSKTLANRSFAIKKGSNTIELKNLGENVLYASVVNNGILPIGEEKEIQRNLSVYTKFRNRDGSLLDVSSISQGTDFVAEVTITNTTGSKIKDMSLTEVFPSGWEIVNTRFTDFGDFAQNKVTYEDIRDDRVNFYFDMKDSQTKTFRILLNASYLGKYYLPGVQVEAMYDNDYMARTQGKWVQVSK